ncbi:hypothetical protein SLEP1_g40891 [Rubroshorea leprosula]|uniref:Uncharacterized protein n=1 Tax=Rubroshorea leprosula TaxID=152421 RepID=A0AAV5L654_9ROSI|nr:hypothetical protein SLEP1_g40891 [Rubroshorea leprosula]
MKRLRAAVLLGFLSVLSGCLVTSANVILIGNDITLCLRDIEADFTPSIKGSGECGVLYLAEPLDACSDLTNQIENVTRSSYPFALVIRGGCCPKEKVRKVQKAGFRAAIIYGNEDDGDLFSVLGDAAGIKIHAVFISEASGKKLKKYAGRTDMKLCLIPNIENSAWSIMAISFISLLTMSAVLGTCLFVCRHRIRQERPRSSNVCDHEFHGMSKRLVKTMPSLRFTAVLEDNTTSRTCAICLEDYTLGEKLRILPCCHSKSFLEC